MKKYAITTLTSKIFTYANSIREALENTNLTLNEIIHVEKI